MLMQIELTISEIQFRTAYYIMRKKPLESFQHYYFIFNFFLYTNLAQDRLCDVR